MGYEFCPMGQGGVLETTGLFASPCSKSVNQKLKNAEMKAVLPTYTGLTGMGGIAGLTGMLSPVMAKSGGSSFGKRSTTRRGKLRLCKPVKRVRKVRRY
jgi:hypothetical protein